MSSASVKFEAVPFVTKEGNWTISFSLFGWGFYIAWRYIGFQTTIITPLESVNSLFGFSFRLIALFIQAAVLTGLLFYFHFACDRSITGKALIKIASITGAAGVALLIASNHVGAEINIAFLVAGWVLFGASAAICTCLWLRLFSVVSIQELCLYVSGSLILGAVTTYILCYLPQPVSQIVTALLPATSMLMSHFARRYVDYDAKFAEQKELLSNSTSQPPRFNRLMFIVAIYAFVYSALIAPLSTRGGSGLESDGWFMLLPPIIAGALVIAVTWFTARMSKLNNIYRAVLSVMVITLIVFPFVQGTSLSMAGLLGSLGYELFNIICFVIIADFAEHDSMPKVRALTIGRIIYFWGIFFGNVLSVYLAMNNLYKDKPLFTTLCLGAVIILVITTTVVFSEAEVLGKTTARDDTTIRSLVMPSAEDIFECKASRIALRYNLTPRETEVFMLLSKGRSNKLIEERLVISGHTVDSHVTHIYRKCDVHSRQEIMDMIEEEHVSVEELAERMASRKLEEE